MSFFAFDPTLPKLGHNKSAPGFSQAADPFAGLQKQGDDHEALEFEEYDGLADQLDERDDALNNDTFGDGGSTGNPVSKPVGKDFDFFGQTAKVSSAITEEQMRFSRQQAVPKITPTSATFQHAPSKPSRTGYERYKEVVPDMRVDASLWGVAPKPVTPTTSGSAPTSGRKMMSLEEVEAAMRAQVRKPVQTQSQRQPDPPQQLEVQQPPAQVYQSHPEPFQQQSSQHVSEPEHRFPTIHPTQILQRPARQSAQPTGSSQSRGTTRQTQILQNPDRHPSEPQRTGILQYQGHQSHSSGNRHVITHPQELVGLPEEERNMYLMEDAKRAKRNHKIYLLSKDNGLMTPQDKNFITRIQLQQLVTATGNPNEHGTDSSLTEDFYYQVHSQIRGGPRQHPNQPLSHFAQTYLFQTGGRLNGMRRYNRGGDNHVQRMEQQVQRAVEAAKNKPKNKQLVLEGSLGKISFSNANTPKPLLNIKRTDSGQDVRPNNATRDRKSQAVDVSGSDINTVLSDIEDVYLTLMQLDDHDRKMPPPEADESNQTLAALHVEWQENAKNLNTKLWKQLKVHEPIGATSTHPFIAFLSFSKGKRTIPRVFRYITHEQRTTILTMIVVHLDQLDIVRHAQLLSGETQLNARIRENVELFSLAVMPSLFAFLNEAQIDIVTGILGLILTLNVDVVARTRIGVSMLTMVLSRAELIKQGSGAAEQEWEQWVQTYDKLFDALEPILGTVFPGTVHTGEDVYVWQFLAAIGIGASPDQQQRLVMAVKDRVMETVGLAKTLPPAMSSQRLANVNLFMRSIGLDVELLA